MLVLSLFVIAPLAYADCCDVYSATAVIIAPNGQTHSVSCSYQNTSGTCNSSSAATVEYSCNIGYSFCPVEGTYDVNFILSVANDPDCDSSNTRTEYRLYSDFYDVNYDASSGWCTCKLGSGHWAIGGEVAANSCCGDDSGEYVRDCQGDSAVCNESSDNLACCDAPTDCVYDDTCYPSGTSYISLGGGTYVCNDGQWTNCLPPPSTDWNIISTCAISSAISVAQNVWVKAGGILHVLSGGHITVGGGYIFVLPGGEIQIDQGGQID